MKPTDPRINPAHVPPGSRAIVIAEHQAEFIDLPAVRTLTVVDDHGKVLVPPYVITRWELTDDERAALVRGEDVYITLISSGAIHPMFVTVGPTDWRW